VTVGESLRDGCQCLEQAGVQSPHLTAELLLASVLGWDRVRVLAHPELPVSAAAGEAFSLLIERRAAGTPLQHLTGVQEFYGRPFRVSPSALIPRPETEFVVEKAVKIARSASRGMRIVDVGTGSGCIAVSVACEVPLCDVTATDISADALGVARGNARALAGESRVKFVCCDLLEAFPRRALFDLILSNPPYVPRADEHKISSMVRDHEPHVALFGGETGLDVYERLVPQAAERLAPGGRLILEMGYSQAEQVRDIARKGRLDVVESLDDLQGIPRCIVARRSDG
jgi:release factor glutamine methyltransferase